MLKELVNGPPSDGAQAERLSHVVHSIPGKAERPEPRRIPIVNVDNVQMFAMLGADEKKLADKAIADEARRARRADLLVELESRVGAWQGERSPRGFFLLVDAATSADPTTDRALWLRPQHRWVPLAGGIDVLLAERSELERRAKVHAEEVEAHRQREAALEKAREEQAAAADRIRKILEMRDAIAPALRVYLKAAERFAQGTPERRAIVAILEAQLDAKGARIALDADRLDDEQLLERVYKVIVELARPRS